MGESREEIRRLLEKLSGARVFMIRTAHNTPEFFIHGTEKRHWAGTSSAKEDAETIFLFLESVLPWTTLVELEKILKMGEGERLTLYKRLLKERVLQNGIDASFG